MTPHSAMVKTKDRYVGESADAPAKTPEVFKTAAANHANERRMLEKHRSALSLERETWELHHAEAAAANEENLAFILPHARRPGLVGKRAGWNREHEQTLHLGLQGVRRWNMQRPRLLKCGKSRRTSREKV